jgi:hypothetical protein
MPQRFPFSLILVLTCAALLSAACGGSPEDNASKIATSVAQTIEAQNSPTPATAIASATPFILPTASTAPAGIPTSATQTRPTSAPAAGGEAACMKASLVGENVPDGTILKPGQQFTKTWKIKNDSGCTWDTSYKIVFWDGNVMGGGYVYNFPQQALPGDIVDVPLVLTAPMEDGNYQSFWKLQTPGGSSFGVGYDTAFWADIIVSSSDKVKYGVTSVTYAVERNPLSGCPTNVFYTIYATISVNGPVSVTYNWRKSDDTIESKKTINFTEAGSKTVSVEWSLHTGATAKERWVQLFTIEPIAQDYGKATFQYSCGS